MSFTDFLFPDRRHSGPVTRLGPQTVEDHRRRLAREIARVGETRQTLDLATRVSELERDLDQAAVVVEALVELIAERIGISREEIGGRVAQLIDAVDEPDAPAAEEPREDAPVVISQPLPEPPKDRFVPRRNWRDARGM